jgi:C-terminal processing protease CtpA/Prc
MKRNHWVNAAVVVAMILVVSWVQAGSATTQEVENLRAFAKLYGYLRYFYPGDTTPQNAGQWWQLLYIGAQPVAEAQDTAELQQALYDVFLPLAPELRLEPSDGSTPASAWSPVILLDEEDTVAWQHRGDGVSMRPLHWTYWSLRTNRPHSVAPDSGMYRTVGALEHRGRELRLRAAARAAVKGEGNQGKLALTMMGIDNTTTVVETMDEQSITASVWETYELTCEVPDDAIEFDVVLSLEGDGIVWFDAIELSVREPGGSWQTVAVSNAGFEDPTDPFIGWGVGLGSADIGEAYCSLEEWGVFEGHRCVRIASRITKLFDWVPGPGEVIRKDIGGGLRCVVPLTVEDEYRGQPALEKRAAGLPASTNDGLRGDFVAVVVQAWNLLQHFYPYFDVVDVDWDQELTRALQGALTATDREQFTDVLRRLVAALDDGHGYVIDAQSQEGWLPVYAEEIESKVVVYETGTSLLEPGDILRSIDGVAIENLIEQEEDLVSGSPQWKQMVVLSSLGRGANGTAAAVEIDRSGEVRTVEVERSYQGAAYRRPEMIAELTPGVLYVDLTRCSLPEVVERLDDLVVADGVIFDLRGYPSTRIEILLQHLTDVPLRSAHWNVPQIIYPDQESIVGWDTSQWFLEPRQPRIPGHVVFLTDAQAISYAESIMGIVEHYRLGDIVGRPTAGTNGNVNISILGFGYEMHSIGMKVLKPDGSQHHLVGILPTHPVERTLQAVREGRDEDIEKALELILGTSSH